MGTGRDISRDMRQDMRRESSTHSALTTMRRRRYIRWQWTWKSTKWSSKVSTNVGKLGPSELFAGSCAQNVPNGMKPTNTGRHGTQRPRFASPCKQKKNRGLGDAVEGLKIRRGLSPRGGST